MHSGSQQPGRRCVPQRSDSCQHWLHNGPALRREPVLPRPCWQGEEAPPRLDGRKETRLRTVEELEELEGGVSTDLWGRLPSNGPKLRMQPGSHMAQDLGHWNLTGWMWTPEPGPRFRAVGERFGEYFCPGHHCRAGPHPLRMKCVPLPPNGIRGEQDHRTAPGGVVGWQLGRHAPERRRTDPLGPKWIHSGTQGYDRQHAQSSAPFPGPEFSSGCCPVNDSARPKRQPEGHCNGLGSTQKGIFATEIPQTRLAHTRQRGPLAPATPAAHLQPEPPGNTPGRKAQPGLDGPKKKQASVRDQIRRVVRDLEEVLCGLKQVHLEMKEVVQQIELLTSHIDLTEADEAGSSSVKISSGHTRVRGQGSTRAQPMPPAPSPSVLMTDRGVPLNHYSGPPGPGPDVLSNGIYPTVYPPRDGGREAQDWAIEPERPLPTPTMLNQRQGGSHGSGMVAPVNRRPPPYPHDRQVEMLEMGTKGPPSSLKTPPHPGKHRHASSVV